MPCGNDQCIALVNGCAWSETTTCTYVFPGVLCTCGVDEYIGTANDKGTCSYLVRPSVRVATKLVTGRARSLFIYLPNCSGTFTAEEVLG